MLKAEPGIPTQVKTQVPLEHKAVDDVLGGAEAWKNADQTDGVQPYPQPCVRLPGRRHSPRIHLCCVS